MKNPAAQSADDIRCSDGRLHSHCSASTPSLLCLYLEAEVGIGPSPKTNSFSSCTISAVTVQEISYRSESSVTWTIYLCTSNREKTMLMNNFNLTSRKPALLCSLPASAIHTRTHGNTRHSRQAKWFPTSTDLCLRLSHAKTLTSHPRAPRRTLDSLPVPSHLSLRP
jgi:hypothetical protein